jgi:hypothetical protein
MTEEDSRVESILDARKEPITIKDKALGAVIAIVFFALCAGTWLSPGLLSLDISQFSGRGGRTIAWLVNTIWSRPVGTIAGIIALIMVWGLLTKKVGDRPNSESRGE